MVYKNCVGRQVQLMTYVILAYQHSFCKPSCIFIKGPCLVLKILELQPEHVHYITDGFTLYFLDIVGTGRFIQFYKDIIDYIMVNTSHTLHHIFPYCKNHT